MPYKFPLTTVLRVRMLREEREERMLQQILNQITQTIHTIADVDVQLETANRKRRAEVLRPVAGIRLHDAYGEIAFLRERRKELQAQLEQFERLKEMQFTIYTTARRDREMLTEIHEQKRNVYAFELARREQSTLDDNFIARRNLALRRIA